MMRVKYLMLVFGFFLLGCEEPKFETEDFIGVWKSNDNATITFNQDGTCILNNLNNAIISISKNENEKINSKGTWKILNNVNSGITGGKSTGVKISYNLMDRKGKGGILFYISGQGISDKEPWDLFVWKGDPDEMIKYQFIKQPK
ncbi:hypothetical protein [Chitinophaga nivalis]|uniref:Lipocalin-like domain-containing protein n=1 Tax=Chitinophaga nivalis TaxID=2991709 RepID=A0ABT3IJ65_9BACT|nr:hypothetical protein [Chitinophaga nivalis]MCW3466296.1 hypothetical protein [Chitinophaga nivalis]MCW3484013.1 hypothetical protein [Chitinophaga nivalis]